MKLRKNITISPELLEWAQRIMRARRFDDFSEFLGQLIREEHERLLAQKEAKKQLTQP